MFNPVLVTHTPSGSAGIASAKIIRWESVQVNQSLDEICHSIDLRVPTQVANRIQPHDKIEVRVYNENLSEENKGRKNINLRATRRLTTVLVDEISRDVGNTKNARIIGRSPARDIIDSSWTGKIVDQTLYVAVKSIASEFNISNVSHLPKTIDFTQPVSFDWTNESPWQRILNEADNQGLIITSSEAGGLYIQRFSKIDNLYKPQFNISQDMIEQVSYQHSGQEQFHTYTVQGNGKNAKRTDSSCKSKRKLAIVMNSNNVTPSHLERRASIEVLRRRERKATVNLPRWGLSSKKTIQYKEIFFKPGYIIDVSASASGLSGKYIISRATFQASVQSVGCEVTLTNPEVYQPEGGR